MKNPQLSIVIAGRNDNYGGDFSERLQRCFSSVYAKLTAHRVFSEIIFVNYNPLEKPAIEKFINWEKSNEFVSVKLITITSQIHDSLPENGNSKKVLMLEYFAKNAGIRKSTGEFILCMNPDILLPESFFKTISSLRKDFYYCSDRIDFKSYENLNPGGIFRISMKGHSFDYKKHSRLNYYYMRFKNLLLCEWKYRSVDFRNFFERRNWNVYFHNIEYRYHCNVSGDFMLMHRENWNQVKGYNEQTYLSLHIDALMVIQAAALGLKEKIINTPVFHKEHERRHDATRKNAEYREAYLWFQNEAKKMLEENKPAVYNNDNWGLKNFELKEQII